MELNEHILNFHKGDPVVPKWLPETLRLIIGAGDLNHDSITNIEKFSTFDVFFCKPWPSDSLQENIDYLLTHYSKKKIICFIDADNKEQIKKFVNLFCGRFSLIDGHGGHCPHLEFTDIQRLLKEGAYAMNLFEQSENLMSYEEAKHWLKNGYFKNSGPGFLTSKILDREAELRGEFLEKAKELQKTSRITCIPFEELSVRELQYCCRSLLFTLPFNLIGSCSFITKDWRHSALEFTVKKVTPDLKEQVIAEYIEKNGLDDYAKRVLFIIDKIKEDIEKGSPHASRKYDTLCKHIEKLI